jgi:hypothetical protein
VADLCSLPLEVFCGGRERGRREKEKERGEREREEGKRGEGGRGEGERGKRKMESMSGGIPLNLISHTMWC